MKIVRLPDPDEQGRVYLDLWDLVKGARTKEEYFRIGVLNPLLLAGLIEMVVPAKPRSSRQRYRLTAKGQRFLARATPKSRQ